MLHLFMDILKCQALLLPVRDIFSLARCNKRLYEILWQNSYMWKQLWYRDISDFVVPKDKEYKIAYAQIQKAFILFANID